MFDRHPTLFKDREDCFNQLFCSGGEDYEWKDGELVLRDANGNDRLPINRLKDGKAFRYNRMSIYDEELALAGELGLTGVYPDKRLKGIYHSVSERRKR